MEDAMEDINDDFDDDTPLTILARPKQLADQSIVALYGLDTQHAEFVLKRAVLPDNLGSRMVKITCRSAQSLDQNLRQSHVNLPISYHVHENLLCAYSRYFNELLEKPFEKQVLSEVFETISKHDDVHFPIRDNPHLPREASEIPSGYVPSWVTTYTSYLAQDDDEEILDGESTVEQHVCSVDEYTDLFGVLVHWLYTQEILILNVSLDKFNEAYARVYAMSERLDVPGLRQACYNELREIYDVDCLPSVEVAEIIFSECSRESQLQSYVVGIVAHVMIAGEDEAKEHANILLDLNGDFAAQVAEKTLMLLRSGTSSTDPSQEARYAQDDSDSDFVPESENSEDTDNYISESDLESETNDKDEASVPMEKPEFSGRTEQTVTVDQPMSLHTEEAIKSEDTCSPVRSILQRITSRKNSATADAENPQTNRVKKLNPNTMDPIKSSWY